MTEPWDPGSYLRFRDHRLRPARDLLAVVGTLPDGDLVDLGCGPGTVALLLRARFPGRLLVGLDASDTMLAEADLGGSYDALVSADIACWQAETPPALIFSNAALHWLPDHATLLPRLAGMLAPGGVLAVQMPRQGEAPSHRLLHATAMALWPGRFAAPPPQVAAPEVYHDALAPLGRVDLWETTYLQHLAPVGAGHPVRLFTQSTAARPILGRLTPGEVPTFLAAYDAALEEAYPRQPDGGVLFAFRRLFLTLTRGA